MTRYTVTTVLLILNSYFGIAQGAFVAKDVTPSGEPIGTKLKSVEIIPGTDVTLQAIYHPTTGYSLPKAYLFVDQVKLSGDTVEHSTKMVRTTEGQPFIKVPVTFIESGHYLLSFADARKNVMAKIPFRVKFMTNVFFSRKLDPDARPMQKKKFFAKTIGTDKYHFYISIETPQPFGTQTVILRILQQNAEIKYHSIYQKTLIVNPKSTLFATEFPENFKPGEYLIQFIGAGGKLIGENFVTLLDS